jgi:hypothetical protein
MAITVGKVVDDNLEKTIGSFGSLGEIGAQGGNFGDFIEPEEGWDRLNLGGLGSSGRIGDVSDGSLDLGSIEWVDEHGLALVRVSWRRCWGASRGTRRCRGCSSSSTGASSAVWKALRIVRIREGASVTGNAGRGTGPAITAA